MKMLKSRTYEIVWGAANIMLEGKFVALNA